MPRVSARQVPEVTALQEPEAHVFTACVQLVPTGAGAQAPVAEGLWH